MSTNDRTTQIRDEYRNLVSVLNEALQGTEACAGYALDAEMAGDERFADFFREVQRMHESIVERAEGMLDTTPRRSANAPISGAPADGDPGDVSPGQDVAS